MAGSLRKAIPELLNVPFPVVNLLSSSSNSTITAMICNLPFTGLVNPGRLVGENDLLFDTNAGLKTWALEGMASIKHKKSSAINNVIALLLKSWKPIKKASSEINQNA